MWTMCIMNLYLQLLKVTPCLLTSSHVSLEFLICILKLVLLLYINYIVYLGTIVGTKYYLLNLLQPITLFSIVNSSESYIYL